MCFFFFFFEYFCYTEHSGVADTDLMIYVTADSSQCTTTLAFAAWCDLDQYNRPVAGYINYCPNSLSSRNWKQDDDTTLHEITHVTIMSPGLLDRFIDDNGATIAGSNVYE